MMKIALLTLEPFTPPLWYSIIISSLLSAFLFYFFARRFLVFSKRPLRITFLVLYILFSGLPLLFADVFVNPIIFVRFVIETAGLTTGYLLGRKDIARMTRNLPREKPHEDGNL